jgi:PAS domain S-box-containing protein
MTTAIPMEVNLKQRVKTLRWLVPIVVFLGSLLYQFGFARWVSHTFGEDSHYWVEVGFYTAAGSVIAFWTISVIQQWIEKSESVQNQARLTEHRLASITSASADAILSVDHSGNIQSWNRGAELLFGYVEEEVLGMAFSDLLVGPEGASTELQWLMDNIHQNGFIREHETICHDSSGKHHYVELTGTQLLNLEDLPIGASLILRDISARKKREEEIQRLNTSLNQQVEDRTRELAEKVVALDKANQDLQRLDQMRAEFISLVSHQIRAPLTNMRGAIARMEEGCNTVNSTCNSMFLIVDQQVTRLERLVQRVLHAIRIEAEELRVYPEPLSLMPFLNQILDQTKTRSSDHAIHLPLKPGLPMILADRDHLSEVMTNLLDNADKYSPEGSDVILDVRASQEEIIISIRDQGPGIPDSDLEQVFQKYYRSDNSDSQRAYGYGLGLFVCRSLVEAQGGRIWAENHRDGGSIFSIALPVWQGERG